MSSYNYSLITPITFARDWTRYDYITETRLDVLKRKLSDTIDHLRNKIEYNQKIVRLLQEELRVQVENLRKDYPIDGGPEEARDRRSVFAFNIGGGALAEELKWYFGMCGTVEDVILLRENDKSNSAAYVVFKDEIYANLALCMTSSLFMGQRIYVVPRNMTIELNLMQAITKFWGQHLESHFVEIGPLKMRLRLINTISGRLQDLIEVYVSACQYNQADGSSQKLMALIKRSKKLLSNLNPSTAHKITRRYLEDI